MTISKKKRDITENKKPLMIILLLLIISFLVLTAINCKSFGRTYGVGYDDSAISIQQKTDGATLQQVRFCPLVQAALICWY